MIGSEDIPEQPTIFAPATPPGKSALAVLRISGPNARLAWESTRRKGGEQMSAWPPKPRRAYLRDIVSPRTNEKLDEGIIIYFPGISQLSSTRFRVYVLKISSVADSSLTAQDIIEYHLHGSTAVMRSVLQGLSTLRGFRPAEPGEFTRLAFDNGRMDLTEVEGFRDLIESETEEQRKLAIRQASVSHFPVMIKPKRPVRLICLCTTRVTCDMPTRACDQTSSLQCPL